MTPCTECRYASECPHSKSEPPTCLKQGEHPAVKLLKVLAYDKHNDMLMALLEARQYLDSIRALEDEDEE